MAVLVGTLKQDILTLLALVVFSSVLESLFSPFGAQPCNVSLVRRNLIQDKKLQQFCDKICQPPHFPAEIYLLRNCRCNLTFCRVFENEKKIHLRWMVTDRNIWWQDRLLPADLCPRTNWAIAR